MVQCKNITNLQRVDLTWCKKGADFLTHFPKQLNSRKRGTEIVQNFSDKFCSHVVDDESIVIVDEMLLVFR